MLPFEYSVSLRVVHPELDLDCITKELGLAPRHVWKAGDHKQTPTGAALGGKRCESYWSHRFEHPDGMVLSDFLEILAIRLLVHGDFLRSIASQGGSLFLFIGWFSGDNSGDRFSPDLLQKLSELRIGLSLDVYGNSDRSE